jgi:Arc/MetJ-type ribon-helix-helix transcriptional regulator
MNKPPREPTYSYGLEMPWSMHRALQAAAVARGVSMSLIVRTACQEWLDREAASQNRDASLCAALDAKD